MKLITRYILWNCMTIFVMSLLFFVGGVTVFFVLEATFTRGLPLPIALKVIPYAIPEILTFALPVTILLAVCFSYAKMSASNEIIALKTMGVAPWRLMVPTWIVVFLLSLLTVWLNDLSLSWGRMQMARVVIEGTEEWILGALRSEGKFALADNSFILEVSDVDENGLLITPYITARGEFRGRAEKARLLLDFKNSPPQIRFQMTGAYIENEKIGISLPQDFEYVFPLDKIIRENYQKDPPMSRISEELEMILKERETLRRTIATKTAFGLAVGNYDVFQDDLWLNRLYIEDGLNMRYNRLRLIIPRRTANGFCCFFFVWVGIPLAILLNRSDYFACFFYCFIPTLLIYYPLLMFGIQEAKNGNLPPVFVWTGNVVMCAIGCSLLYKVHKH